jgi:phosphoribosylamine---glycine ligase
MNVLVVGNGGREHALGWKISLSSKVHEIHVNQESAFKEKYFIGGNFNQNDSFSILEYVKENNIGLVVIGPEVPLVNGICDILRENQIPCFGPNKNGAQLEGSKLFAKLFMEKYSIPTGKFSVCENLSEVETAYNNGFEVIKLNGLAAGKGVLVSQNLKSALNFAENHLNAGEHKIIMEEKLSGQEVSILAFLDGENYLLLPPSQDHKRIFDNDKGPNTGGMGAYTPVPIEKKVLDNIKVKVINPFMEGLKKEKINYRGIIYFGIMLTPEIPKVLEFNCRFGDPETQPLLFSMKNDIFPYLYGAAIGKLPLSPPEFKSGVSMLVVLAAKNYPQKPQKGDLISGLEKNEKNENLKVFYAGVKETSEGLITNGGRVLGVTAYGDTFEIAQKTVYDGCKLINWSGIQYRSDIGKEYNKFSKT